MSFRLVPKSVTLNDLELRKWPLHCVISLTLVNLRSNTTPQICSGIYVRVYCIS